MFPGQRFANPPVWDTASLEQSRQQATAAFIRERAAVGGKRYRTALLANIARVGALFSSTDNLRTLVTGAALAENPSLIDAARYLGGPPISADDLNTLADANIAKRRRLPADLARRAAEIIEAALDQERFPWLFAESPRDPTGAERDAAIRWTAGLMTAQAVQTMRRSESAKRQQTVVLHLLKSLGFEAVPGRPIDIVSHIGRGEFCREESIVAGTKCDVPIGLRDGRLLLIECKVSNSALNSVKRLNREVGGKAGHWRARFGEGAITAAVLAGVFKLKNLSDAQEAGVTLFWEHDLTPLRAFLEAAV
jgi:hypothetical protein